MNTLRHCFNLDCERLAEWAIWWGEHYEEYTEMCTEHVGEGLQPERLNYVDPIDQKISPQK